MGCEFSSCSSSSSSRCCSSPIRTELRMQSLTFLCITVVKHLFSFRFLERGKFDSTPTSHILGSPSSGWGGWGIYLNIFSFLRTVLFAKLFYHLHFWHSHIPPGSAVSISLSDVSICTHLTAHWRPHAVTFLQQMQPDAAQKSNSILKYQMIVWPQKWKWIHQCLHSFMCFLFSALMAVGWVVKL